MDTTQLKCKVCGASLKLGASDVTFVECPYCGTQISIAHKDSSPAAAQPPIIEHVVENRDEQGDARRARAYVILAEAESKRTSAKKYNQYAWMALGLSVFFFGSTFIFSIIFWIMAARMRSKADELEYTAMKLRR